MQNVNIHYPLKFTQKFRITFLAIIRLEIRGMHEVTTFEDRWRLRRIMWHNIFTESNGKKTVQEYIPMRSPGSGAQALIHRIVYPQFYLNVI